MPLERAKGQRDIHYHLITKQTSQSKMMVTGRCFFAGLVMTAMNGNDAVSVTFNVWDSDGTLPLSGRRLAPQTFKKTWAAGAVDNFFTLSYDPPVRAADGIYVHIKDITGRVYFQVIYDQ